MQKVEIRQPHSFQFWLSVSIAFFILLFPFSYIFNIVFPAPDFYDRSDVGCYWTNALLVYVECKGFFGASIVAFIRMFFLLVIYLVMILFSYPLVGIVYSLIFASSIAGLALFLWLGERAFLWSKTAWLR